MKSPVSYEILPMRADRSRIENGCRVLKRGSGSGKLNKELAMRRWFKSLGFGFALLLVFLCLKLALSLFVFQQPSNAFLPDS
ncbi:MAG: hypothetical protein L0Y55_20205, partial [Anaerolineales bacterium]|nr:hypothetical protein [Anaerolineales bacterium]